MLEEPVENTAREAPKLERGKGNGRPRSEAITAYAASSGRQRQGGPPAQDIPQVVRALARLALQQETSIKVRDNTT